MKKNRMNNKDRRQQKDNRQHVVDCRQGKTRPFLSTVYGLLSTDKSGFSLVEILVTLAVFSILVILVFAAYNMQVKTATKEYRLGEAEVEIGIAKNVIERDLNMAGYGLADDYDFDGDGTQNFTPRAAAATDGGVTNPDTLTLMGTALGIKSRAAQGWTYASTADPAFPSWNDAREDAQAGDAVIIMEPSTRKLLAKQTGAAWEWLFQYNPNNMTFANRLVTMPGNNALSVATALNPAVGTMVYGLYTPANIADATAQPYYAVWYGLGGTPPSTCAPGTQSLIRNESRTGVPTSGAGGSDPILDCVLDFEVAFGLDTDTTRPPGPDKPINFWDNGGVQAATYAPLDLRKRLKQIRVYLLVQSGAYDQNYTYPAATIRVGDNSLGVGRDVPLAAPAQTNYRWRLITMQVTPRNIR